MKTTTRVKQTGEIFTPSPLVQEILDKLPPELITNPSKTILDPACGNGQFLIEVLKRRNTFTNIYGVDLMADNTCDTIARLAFFDKYKIDLFDSNAQPITKLEIDPHLDHHTYQWLKEQSSFERVYILKSKCIIVRLSKHTTTGSWFEYSFDDVNWTFCPTVACADSLKFNYDEFEDVI